MREQTWKKKYINFIFVNKNYSVQFNETSVRPFVRPSLLWSLRVQIFNSGSSRCQRLNQTYTVYWFTTPIMTIWWKSNCRSRGQTQKKQAYHKTWGANDFCILPHLFATPTNWFLPDYKRWRHKPESEETRDVPILPMASDPIELLTPLANTRYLIYTRS